MRRGGLAGLALLLSAAGAESSSCLPPDVGTPMSATTSGPVAAALRFSPATVKVGSPFVIDISVCSLNNARIERLAIDARMPAHRHGMNYKPEIASKGDGSYEARGFLFHMPGRWEITLSVTGAAGGKPQYLTLELDVR